MDELGLDLEALKTTFTVVHEAPYLLVEIPVDRAPLLAEQLAVPFRRCYMTDKTLEERHAATSMSKEEITRRVLPDIGSVMSGDFGEILTALFSAAREYPERVLDPKKLRLKVERTKAAPKSDVVQFVVPEWPTPSDRDRVLCAEVKTKATKGTFTPIQDAIEGSAMDRAGRLAKTLLWLQDRAILGDLGTVTLDHINRFLDATDHPPADREFRAVAVICANLVAAEATDITLPDPEECALIVITVPDLKSTYQAVFDAIVETADSTAP
ncbi:Hachiman antiphage defense system protein HamA [Nocardia sp. NPDC048505]|uniref:Hachiman antiphage defense system protein HamA n=1 Tax=unclassified Nocardia TaxID=2637762 RepID=UPI0033F543D3